MDVGVSLNTQESYRYAEFYNVSVEECPTDCGSERCGKQTTACGTELDCSPTCDGGRTCYDGFCMTCPPLSENLTRAECGTHMQICTNAEGQKLQVHRTLGFAAPSSSHHCAENNMWECRSRSKWSYLTEGKDCGSVTDQCGATVDLFECPRTNDRCQDHKCICHPSEFPDSWNCGSEPDGCGTIVYFGTQDGGACPNADDVCIEHHCCTKKTRSSFPAHYNCGTATDGCGGTVYFGECGMADLCNEANNTCYTPDVPPVNWMNVEGSCQVDGKCLTSQNYPENYGNNEACTATVAGLSAGPQISVEDFQTEGYFDKLYITGQRYSGTISSGTKMPAGDISWRSDFIVTKKGWKLCVEP